MRVFEQKEKAILKDFYIAFGDYKGTIWLIEYQKRGFLYMHCLLFLFQDIDYTNRNLINRTVWAKLPDEKLDLTGSLIKLVKTHILYSPCGNINPECICIKDKNDRHGQRCKASYPKQFQEETSIQEDGYLLYCSQNGTGPQRQ